jgi:hypothetical protein
LTLAARAAVGFQFLVLETAAGTDWLRKLVGKKACAWAWVSEVGMPLLAMGVPGLVELASRVPVTPEPVLPPVPR